MRDIPHTENISRHPIKGYIVINQLMGNGNILGMVEH